MIKIYSLWTLFLVNLLAVSCKETSPQEVVSASPDTNHTTYYPPVDTNEIIQPKVIGPDGDRVAWQKPATIISKLGDQLHDKTIADIGAGPTGFFTFWLAQSGAHVIAIDIDHSALAYIEKEKTLLDTSSRKLIQCRLADAANPKLAAEEADGILIVNTIAYIKNKSAYLQLLKNNLKPNGKLVIVDFKMKRVPEQIAPPKSQRVYEDVLEETLYKLGYKNVTIDDQSLDYQYIITADK